MPRILLSLNIFIAAMIVAAPAAADPADPVASEKAASAHAFTFDAIEGGPLPLSTFAGKTILVVNTASMCGFTRQYQGLQDLYEAYRDKGFVVLGAPSNDFGGQEPGKEADIKKFCEVNFNVNFPLTEKISVRGADAHPFYVWARDTLGAANAPSWNFHKYLVGPDGRLIAAFASGEEPMGDKIRAAVEAAVKPAS